MMIGNKSFQLDICFDAIIKKINSENGQQKYKIIKKKMKKMVENLITPD